jgi:hypothetical protein
MHRRMKQIDLPTSRKHGRDGTLKIRIPTVTNLSEGEEKEVLSFSSPFTENEGLEHKSMAQHGLEQDTELTQLLHQLRRIAGTPDPSWLAPLIQACQLDDDDENASRCDETQDLSVTASMACSYEFGPGNTVPAALEADQDRGEEKEAFPNMSMNMRESHPDEHEAHVAGQHVTDNSSLIRFLPLEDGHAPGVKSHHHATSHDLNAHRKKYAECGQQDSDSQLDMCRRSASTQEDRECMSQRSSSASFRSSKVRPSEVLQHVEKEKEQQFMLSNDGHSSTHKSRPLQDAGSRENTISSVTIAHRVAAAAAAAARRTSPPGAVKSTQFQETYSRRKVPKDAFARSAQFNLSVRAGSRSASPQKKIASPMSLCTPQKSHTKRDSAQIDVCVGGMSSPKSVYLPVTRHSLQANIQKDERGGLTASSMSGHAPLQTRHSMQASTQKNDCGGVRKPKTKTTEPACTESALHRKGQRDANASCRNPTSNSLQSSVLAHPRGAVAVAKQVETSNIESSQHRKEQSDPISARTHTFLGSMRSVVQPCQRIAATDTQTNTSRRASSTSRSHSQARSHTILPKNKRYGASKSDVYDVVENSKSGRESSEKNVLLSVRMIPYKCEGDLSENRNSDFGAMATQSAGAEGLEFSDGHSDLLSMGMNAYSNDNEEQVDDDEGHATNTPANCIGTRVQMVPNTQKLAEEDGHQNHAHIHNVHSGSDAYAKCSSIHMIRDIENSTEKEDTNYYADIHTQSDMDVYVRYTGAHDTDSNHSDRRADARLCMPGAYSRHSEGPESGHNNRHADACSDAKHTQSADTWELDGGDSRSVASAGSMDVKYSDSGGYDVQATDDDKRLSHAGGRYHVAGEDNAIGSNNHHRRGHYHHNGVSIHSKNRASLMNMHVQGDLHDNQEHSALDSNNSDVFIKCNSLGALIDSHGGVHHQQGYNHGVNTHDHGKCIDSRDHRTHWILGHSFHSRDRYSAAVDSDSDGRDHDGEEPDIHIHAHTHNVDSDSDCRDHGGVESDRHNQSHVTLGHSAAADTDSHSAVAYTDRFSAAADTDSECEGFATTRRDVTAQESRDVSRDVSAQESRDVSRDVSAQESLQKATIHCISMDMREKPPKSTTNSRKSAPGKLPSTSRSNTRIHVSRKQKPQAGTKLQQISCEKQHTTSINNDVDTSARNNGPNYVRAAQMLRENPYSCARYS